LLELFARSLAAAAIPSTCFNEDVVTESAKIDGRREAGEQTRQRLIRAALSLIAARGEDAVSLRDITTAAEANVAAVGYHFGSKDALLRIAIEEAVNSVLNRQIEALHGLGEEPPLEAIARVMAAPLVQCGAGGCADDRAHLRILAQVSADPPEDACTLALAAHREAVVAALRRALPEVPDEVLEFRAGCAAGVLHTIATGATPVDVWRLTADQVEQLVLPVLIGALSAPSPRARALA
jgi:AcrR family transcriptional regulator